MTGSLKQPLELVLLQNKVTAEALIGKVPPLHLKTCKISFRNYCDLVPGLLHVPLPGKHHFPLLHVLDPDEGEVRTGHLA
jgi:hypothetical protein